MQDHATELNLSRYADGELRADEFSSVERHLSTCPACRRRLSGYEVMASELREFYMTPLEAQPAQAATHPPVRRQPRLPRFAAVAAVAGILVGYPAIATEMHSPTAAQSSVAPLVIGYKPVSMRPPLVIDADGFVVSHGPSFIRLRLGADVWMISLPPGTPTATYPVGLALHVTGNQVGTNHLDAWHIQVVRNP